MAVIGYDLTLIGFIIVALIALGFLWLARGDRWRSIKFGFFFEHERKLVGDEEDEESERKPEDPTEILWRGEKEKRE